LQIATAAMFLIGMSDMTEACIFEPAPVAPAQLFCNADGSCPNVFIAIYLNVYSSKDGNLLAVAQKKIAFLNSYARQVLSRKALVSSSR